jgi:hypothetical protein
MLSSSCSSEALPSGDVPMPIEFYTGRPEFATTHEMIVRDQLIFALTQCFSNTPTLVAAVFDFSCGEDLDFALFKSDAIIVV